MQSAFVDLGLERDTFLYVSDFFEENEEEIDPLPEDKPAHRPEQRNDQRNDRRDRGPNRQQEERVGEARPLTAPPLAAVPQEASESESRPVVAGIGTAGGPPE